MDREYWQVQNRIRLVDSKFEKRTGRNVLSSALHSVTQGAFIMVLAIRYRLVGLLELVQEGKQDHKMENWNWDNKRFELSAY